MKTDARIEVLYATLRMEELITVVLAELLDIDRSVSKTLGHKSSSLTFKNKIDLITDIRAMERDDAKKFESLAEIRNQFLHNLNVDTFEKCFNNLDGKEKNYKRLYAPFNTDGLNNEDLLKKCFDAHFLELNEIIKKLFGYIYETTFQQGFTAGKKEMSDLIIKSLIDFKNESVDNELIFNEILRRAEAGSNEDR